MKTTNQELETLQDIRKMMERSSRFISLSGWSGVAAGICALIGAWFAYRILNSESGDIEYVANSRKYTLLLIAALTFIAAFISASFFTYLKSKKNHIPVWGTSAKRLMWSVAVPMTAGGLFLLKIIQMEIPGLVAPGCLIIYGIALFSGSKQTLDNIKYLGYAEILLGLICLCFTGYGLWFWTVGFGAFHVIYGVYMWFKYERR